MSDAIKLAEASASIEVELERMDADSVVDQLSTIVGMTLNNPAIPMLARVAAMAALISGAAIGAREINQEGASVKSFHRSDLLPDIAAMLRASATIYEELAAQLASESTPAPLQ
jgi:hypothetical protein